MQSKRSEFNGSGSTGNQSVTGVGFQPEFLIIISCLATTNTTLDDGHFVLGMASGSSDQQAIHMSDDGAQLTINSSRAQKSGKIICATNANGSAVALEAALVSFDADGFTINWSVASSAKFHYIAMAGADFQAHVDSFDMNGSTGQQTVTGVPFQPKAVLFFGVIDNTTEGTTTSGKLSIGCATASNERWALSLYNLDAQAASVAKSYLTESKCIVRTDHSAVTLAADFVAFTSDGFTVDITTALACRMPFVCFGGSADFQANTVTQPTSNGAVAESGIGLAPDAVILVGSKIATLDTITADANTSFGWADENADESFLTLDIDDAAGVSDSRSAHNSNACVVKVRADGDVTEAVAVMSSLDSDGFTLNWTTTNALASIIGYLAMGTGASPGGGGGGRAGWMWAA